MRRMGWAIDWDREVSAHEPSYYHWTQWLFLKFFEHGLAYRREAPVNWCPNDQTVLSNEHVVDGRCWRCGAVVETRNMEQWFFKITAYADELLADLATIDWPERTKKIQRQHIGRSEGAELIFRVEALDLDIPVFTTRPDTVFGATFFVVAPESPLVDRLVEGTELADEVRTYARVAGARPTEERATREKTGLFTGREVLNPATGEQIPIWVADYVLMEYGTGAIMAVPAHDERDFHFAQNFGLPIVQVVAPASGEVEEGTAYVAHSENEVLVNSGEFSGLPAPEGKRKIVEWLDERDLGRATTSYRLRDWLLSRQRYWGCPIPVIHCGNCGIVRVAEADLPVLLPAVVDYLPKGRSPLAAAEDWVHVPCPACGGDAYRETDTMDTFVDSSWYFLRYCDAHNDEAAWDRTVVDNWMPVDQYIGGIEHAILHLMYARFFTKALADLGYLGFQEPFAKLFTQGMITREGAKMSKSRGNVVNPDEYVERYGADTLRSYVLYLGPIDQDADWSDEGAGGIHRFLSRLWRLAADVAETTEPSPDGPMGEPTPLLRKAHWAIDKVTSDLGRRFAFNTAIAAVIELVNDAYRHKEELLATPEGRSQLRFATATAGSLMFPFAPHLGAEVYEMITGQRVWDEPWPEADPALLVKETNEVVVQVNGKLRDRVAVPAGAPDDEQERLARELPKVAAQLDGHRIVKTIVVPGKLVNFVLG